VCVVQNKAEQLIFCAHPRRCFLLLLLCMFVGVRVCVCTCVRVFICVCFSVTLSNALYIILHYPATHCNTIHRSAHTATQCTEVQHTATYCNELQHNAILVRESRILLFAEPIAKVCCSALLQRVATPAATHCNNALQRTATQSKKLQHSRKRVEYYCVQSLLQHLLQHTAIMQCNTLQHRATHCNTHARESGTTICRAFCNSTAQLLQHNARMHYPATYCNTLQHSATHCNTLQHTAAHCNIYARLSLRLTLFKNIRYY